MASNQPPAKVCGICESDRRPVINAFLQGGRTAAWIERQMRDLGTPTKAETVRKHLDRCLNGNPANAAILERVHDTPTREISPNADFAAAIRAEANRLLAAGKLQVSANHGLQAQALIDRREEKAADRKMMVQLAGLLSGARSIEGPPDDLIEGEWVDVTPGADRQTALAPLALVADD